MRIVAITSVIFCLFFQSAACVGNSLDTERIESGLHWLSDRQRLDGAVQTQESRALDEQATAATAMLAREIELPGFVAGTATSFLQAGLQGDNFPQTEFMASAIQLGLADDGNGNDLVDLLLAAQNGDGGFGDGPGYQSTPYDTALALHALNASTIESVAVNSAIQFLIGHQKIDGSWWQGGAPNIEVTALATAALWHHRHRLQGVQVGVQAGMQYLLSGRQGELWENDAQSAQVLLTLLPGTVSSGSLSASVSALADRQMANGSWGDDVYSTALVLRALLMAAKPAPNPDKVRIQGRLVDGDTGMPLVGASVSLSGAAVGSTTSDGEGRFLFDNLAAGQYFVGIQHPGYAAVDWEGSLSPGTSRNLGDIPMTMSVVGIATAYLQGQVTDAVTGLPLQGALISVQGTSLSATTDGEGRYMIPGLSPGPVRVVVSSPGYLARAGDGALDAGQILLFSPELYPVIEQPLDQSGALAGMVVARRHGPGLHDVRVEVTVEGQVFVQQTDPEGRFLFDELPAGVVRIRIQAQGYLGYEREVELHGDTGIDLGHLELIPVSQEYGVTALVLDSVTNEPLQGVKVRVVTANTAIELITDSDGLFSLYPLSEGHANLTFEAEGYITSHTLALLDPGIITDLGQVRMRYAGFRDLLTDLVVVAVDSSSVQTDPGTLAVSGTVRATIHNRGASATQTPFDIVAFYDGNGDGGFDESDIQLGTVRFDRDPGAGVDVAMEVSGRLPYRDAPISVMVDTGAEVVDGDRSNNVRKYSCDKSCVLLEEAFENHYRNEWVQILNGQQHQGFVIVDGTYQSEGSGSAAYVGDPAWQNYSVETAINFPGEASEFAGLMFRYQDQENWYQLRMRSDTVQLVARLGGNPVQVLRSFPANVEPGQWYGLRVRVQGTMASAYLNDQLLFEFNELVLSEGSVGYAEDGVPVQFDNLRVDACTSAFSMALKWHWQGTPGTNADVYGPIMVAHFTDDNGDGVIDSLDIPDLVFHTTGNRLVAVRGDTGETIWVNTSFPVSGAASPAVADLDGDGVMEIISISSNRSHIHIFDNTGSLVRSIPTGPTSGSPRDAVTLADLDGDGSPEIIHGRRVYAASGQLLWEGRGDHGGETGYGILSIAADIDLSGNLEVIAGGTVYNADGSIRWRQPSIGSGFNAIGNFDDDDYPEIVVVSAGRLFLLKHTGEIIWGPVSLGGGTGGPPTVADVDGDGLPDIGVAGAQYFSVFASDGSLKWRQPISDFSSARTGSSVFDFQADGRAELVYADEQFLRVYDGATGVVLAQVPNASGTTLEYPVIADIDNSGSASILVGANGGSTGNRGVKAYGSASNDWVGTRALWNQHAYHINNINDDGTVPQMEEPSWLDHNTYRLNRFPGAGSRENRDFTLSLLTVIDNGAGNPLSASVRVGNAGSLPSPVTTVAFYRGNLKGPLLGTVRIEALQPDTHVDIRMDGLHGLSHLDTLVAVVNPDTRLAECSGDNNIQSIHVDTVRGALTLATDQESYVPGTPVLSSVTVSNTGAFDADYVVHWLIEDADGNLVADLGEENAVGIQSGDSHRLTRTWQTGEWVAGDYRLVTFLYSLQGNELARETIELSVAAVGEEGHPETVSAGVDVDKPRYWGWDQVYLHSHVKNNAVNASFSDMEVVLSVWSPSGQKIWLETLNVSTLAAQATWEHESSFSLIDSPAGLYQVQLEVLASAAEVPLASSIISFMVERPALLSLSGTTTAAPSSVQSGVSVSCRNSLINRSDYEAVEAEIQQLLLKPATEEVISSRTESVFLAPGQSHHQLRTVDTQSLGAGNYSCVQQAVLDGQVVPISHDGFTVSVPLLDMTSSNGSRGRLLVLLDGPARGCPRVKVSELLGHFGRKFHLWDIWAIKSCIYAGLIERSFSSELQHDLDFLLTFLADEGYVFTVVFNADDFERELFSGGYHGYILNQQKFTLKDDTEVILGEAVNRGAGLLASGASIRRNGALERVLGISTTGLRLVAQGVRIEKGALGSDWQEATISPRATHDFDSCGALSLATYINPWKNLLALRRCPRLFGPYPAVTSHSYGDGMGVYLGFDSVTDAAQGETSDDSSTHEALLQYVLKHIQPSEFTVSNGRVSPVTFTIYGVATTTDVKVRLLLPDNLKLVDASLDLEHLDQENNIWLGREVLTPGEALEVNLYVKLLDDNPGRVTMQVWPGSEAEGSLNEFSFDLEPEPARDHLLEAISLLEMLQRDRYRVNIALALKHARVAASRRDAGKVDAAVHEVVNALLRVMSEGSSSAQQARRLLDDELFSLLARSIHQ